LFFNIKSTPKYRSEKYGSKLNGYIKDVVGDEVKKVVDSMSKKQVKDFAKTKTSKLPEKVETKDVDDVKKLEESILQLVQKHTPPTLTKSELIKLISKK
jgi:hypothetical protein